MKPGYKTTEFWFSLVAAVLVPVLGPEGAAAVKLAAASVIAAGYAISRGLAKMRSGNPA